MRPSQRPYAPLLASPPVVFECFVDAVYEDDVPHRAAQRLEPVVHLHYVWRWDFALGDFEDFIYAVHADYAEAQRVGTPLLRHAGYIPKLAGEQGDRRHRVVAGADRQNVAENTAGPFVGVRDQRRLGNQNHGILVLDAVPDPVFEYKRVVVKVVAGKLSFDAP